MARKPPGLAQGLAAVPDKDVRVLALLSGEK